MFANDFDFWRGRIKPPGWNHPNHLRQYQASRCQLARSGRSLCSVWTVRSGWDVAGIPLPQRSADFFQTDLQRPGSLQGVCTGGHGAIRRARLGECRRSQSTRDALGLETQQETLPDPTGGGWMHIFWGGRKSNNGTCLNQKKALSLWMFMVFFGSFFFLCVMVFWTLECSRMCEWI